MKLNKFFFASIITFIILCFSSCDLLNPPQEEEVVTIENISVASVPYKNTYDITAQEAFNSDGLIINVAYSDGTIKESKKFTLSLEDGTFIYNGFKFEKKHVGQLKILVKIKEDEQDFETSFYLSIEETVVNPQNPQDDPQDNPQDNTQDNPQESDPYEGVPPEKQVKDIVVNAEPKKYAEGESLNLEEMDVLVQRGTGYWNYIEDYTISIVNKTTGQILSSTKKLPLGEYTVVITYDDGIKVWKTDYSITVTKPYDIDEFSYSTNNGKATIGGFKGKKTTQTESQEEETYDFDAPYETVYSQPEDFEYEFINGSETDIRITAIKPEKRYLITDLTIPAKIGDYNVKEVSCDIALYEGEDEFKFGLNVRNLIIEEGVEGLVEGTVFWSWEKYQQFFDWVSPYLKKLVLPKGFSLKMKQFNYGTYDNYYFYIRGDQLEDLTLPSDLTVINFDIGCNKLKELIIPSTVTIITSTIRIPVKELIIPESVNSIYGGVFILPEAEKFIFEGKTKLYDNSDHGYYVYLDLPKVTELTFTGEIEVFTPFISECSSLKKIVFSSTAVIKKANFRCENLEEVESNIVRYNTDIFGFDNCTNLKKITINTGDEKIGVFSIGGFRNCTSLESLEIPENIGLLYIGSFEGCTNLKELIIKKTPNSTEVKNFGENSYYYKSLNPDCRISGNAFTGTAIKEFVFEEGLIYNIGENAFEGSSIEKLIFNKNCIVEGFAAFGNDNKVSEIDVSNALFVSMDFSNCSALKTINVGNCAFFGSLDNCVNLKTISLGDDGYFKPYSMQNCSSLQEIVIRGTSPWDSLYEEAFKGCDSVKKIKFQECVLPCYAFGKEGCDNVFELEMENALFDDYSFYKCRGLTKLELAGDYDSKNSKFVFAECSNLQEVKLVGNVGPGEFKDCKSLEKVTVTEALGFYNDCFSNCTKLKTVIIDNDHETLSFKSHCFYNCNSITTFTLPDWIYDNEYDYDYSSFFDDNSFDGNENILNIMKKKNYDFNDVKYLPVFPNTSLVYECDDLILKENFTTIARLKVKNLTIPVPVYKKVRYKKFSEEVIATVYDHGYSLIPAGFAENNKYLETVVLDSDIEARAFKGCSSLTTVTIGDTTFHVAKPDSFENCPKLKKIIVPQEYYEQYKTSPRWENYWDLICTE